MTTSISYLLTVNGIDYPVTGPHHLSLLNAVRNQVGLTGTKEGCDDCECGACMMLLDGRPINSCSYLAAQAQGREITTVEGLSDLDSQYGDNQTGGDLGQLQQALLDAGGVQCGFCTPGMLISARALLDGNENPTDEEIRIGLSGNLCRCTGYTTIVAAVRGLTTSGG